MQDVLARWSDFMKQAGLYSGLMERLWSASNRRIYGDGVSDAAFLDRLSKLIGDHERLRTSTS